MSTPPHFGPSPLAARSAAAVVRTYDSRIDDARAQPYHAQLAPPGAILTTPGKKADDNFAPGRLLTMRTRNSAADKGLHALLRYDGCLDFRTGYPYDLQAYFKQRIDMHHIFPQAWCKANGTDAKRCDSLINKTPISAGTNRRIGGKAPGDYLAGWQKSAGIEPARMDEILRSHLIDPAALRADDFDASSP
jgi:hypothetical protein